MYHNFEKIKCDFSFAVKTKPKFCILISALEKGEVDLDSSFFSESDMEIMKAIARYYYDFGAKRIADESHKHPVYRNVPFENMQIDYSHALEAGDKTSREYYEHWNKELAELEMILG